MVNWPGITTICGGRVYKTRPVIRNRNGAGPGGDTSFPSLIFPLHNLKTLNGFGMVEFNWNPSQASEVH